MELPVMLKDPEVPVPYLFASTLTVSVTGAYLFSYLSSRYLQKIGRIFYYFKLNLEVLNFTNLSKVKPANS